MSGGNDEPNSIAFFLSLALITVAAGFVAAPVLLPLILAAISAGLADPLKLRIDRLFRKRRRLSAAAVLLIMVLAVLTPLFGLVGLLLVPIIMALFVAIWKTFRGRYKGELNDVANGKT